MSNHWRDKHLRLYLDGSGRDDMYICVACDTGSMHKNTVQGHLNGLSHRTILKRERLIDRVSILGMGFDAFKIMREIEYLGLLHWRQDIKAQLFDYIITDNHAGAGVLLSIEKKLQRYTKLEETSLLELAVWKASCLWFDGSRSFSTMQEILDQWAMDESFDAVAYKAERRFTGNIAVIMRGVLEYL